MLLDFLPDMEVIEEENNQCRDCKSGDGGKDGDSNGALASVFGVGIFSCSCVGKGTAVHGRGREDANHRCGGDLHIQRGRGRMGRERFDGELAIYIHTVV